MLWLNFGRWVYNRDRWHADRRLYVAGRWTPFVIVMPRLDLRWS